MARPDFVVWLSAAVALSGASASLAQTQVSSFRGLGFLPDAPRIAAATGLSADGSVVVGWSGPDAFRWSAADGMTALGRLAEPFAGVSVAYSVSGDGQVAVGYCAGSLQGPPFRAFRWLAGDGMGAVGAPPLPGASTGSYAAAVSASGDVIVGASDDQTGTPRAHRWTPSGSWAPIVAAPSAALGLSADGRVAVGLVAVDDAFLAFAWTEQAGLRLLGDLPGGETTSTAYAASADGTVIVGGSSSARSQPQYTNEAFRWTAATGMIPLGDLAGGDSSSEARAVSADGSVIVGFSAVDPSPRTAAFIWDATHGMRRLRDVLSNNFRLDLEGWQLLTANSISADGRTIAGQGINPQGELEGWVAHLGAACPADWNADGEVTAADFFDFIADFLCAGSTCRSADLNADGVQNSADFFAYITIFFAGC